MTRTLTSKLLQAINEVIARDQVSFMKNCQISNLTYQIKTLLDCCEVTEQNGVIVCLNQEKAYNRIQHDYLWESLCTYGIPRSFIYIVQTLYSNTTTTIIINGIHSTPFPVMRGVCQGDPPLLLSFQSGN